MSASSERARIELIERIFAASDARVPVGIGDDAAVLAPPADPIVWTVDAQVEGVHFERAWFSESGLSSLGYRATMAAASDLAAMGAAPIALLSSLMLPAGLTDAELESILIGQREAADALGAPMAGGNLSRASELSITTTAIGSTPKPLLRSGAKPGDSIWHAGPVGLAAAGLAILRRGGGGDARAIDAFLRPRARIEAGLAARALGAHASIDVSDGLARDAGHLATRSGVSIVLDEAAIVDDALDEVARSLALSARDLALYGGEDYALVASFGAAPSAREWRRIGEARAFESGPRLLLRSKSGEIAALEERGFDHFNDRG